jgi:hypothetical protein
MAKKANSNTNDLLSVMTDLLITQLAVAGVQQQTIRQILGCDINRVSRITKHIRAARKGVQAKGKEG